MLKNKLLLVTLFTALLVSALNLIGIKFSLYWMHRNYDILPHLFGGIFTGLFAVCCIVFIKKETVFNFRKTLFLSMTLVLLVGISWEAFELYFNLTFLSDGLVYFRDTAVDIVMDTLGGLLGFLYGRYLSIKNG